MNGQDVRSIVAMLARSQGSYGRMLEAGDDADAWADVADAANAAGVSDAVGFVMWVES